MVRSFTVRLPESVYTAARNMADRRGISLNRLVQEALAEKAERALEERIEKAYDLLAEDLDDAGVETFLGVQAEALLDD